MNHIFNPLNPEPWAPNPEHQTGPQSGLAHGWDRINNVQLFFFMGLSTRKNAKCYPTMTKWLRAAKDHTKKVEQND